MGNVNTATVDRPLVSSNLGLRKHWTCVLLLGADKGDPALHNISEASSQLHRMLAFVMKAGQGHCVSSILVQLRAKLVPDTGHVLLQVILMPSVYVTMAFPVMTVIKVAMVFVLESTLTDVVGVMRAMFSITATDLEDATISTTVNHTMVSACTSRRGGKVVVCVEMIMTVRWQCHVILTEAAHLHSLYPNQHPVTHFLLENAKVEHVSVMEHQHIARAEMIITVR